MIRAFERMTQGVLSILGEDALFAGVVHKVNIEYNVQFVGADAGVSNSQYRGEVTVVRDVATVPNTASPKQGMTFQFVDLTTGQPTGSVYKLDKYIDTNGYSKRFVALKVS